MGKETRAIKFYMNEKSVNKIQKQEIMQFLSECQTVENILIDYYWDNFKEVIKAYNNKNFYNNRIPMPEPRIKFHHYMNILFQVYEMLKSVQSNIINNKMYFKLDNKEQQRIYNYCKGFCFRWDKLEKYIDKQLKSYKKKDKEYYDFLSMVKCFISVNEQFETLKSDIEDRFCGEKSKINKPVKHNFQLRCNTFHTVEIDKSNEKKWLFKIDSNKIIGGTDRKPVFDSITIPVKISNYHKNILENHALATTFNLKLNSYGKLEIIGTYETEIKYPKTNDTEHYLGIDIGLNNLITTSDGEIIEQNPKIVKQLERVLNKQSNRQSLEEHLKKKYDDENFKLSDKNYKKLQNRVTRFVTCDNRKKLKQFVKSYENTSTQIIMEDLDLHEAKTHSKKVNNMMKRLHIHRIKEDIMNYSKLSGIKIGLVNPAFTSQECPMCGCVDKRNRATQSEFKCIECGYESNADLNASQNIKNRYFDERINLDTPVWRIKEILIKE